MLLAKNNPKSTLKNIFMSGNHQQFYFSQHESHQGIILVPFKMTYFEAGLFTQHSRAL